MLFVVGCLLFVVVCCLLHVVCCLFFCCMLYVVCCYSGLDRSYLGKCMAVVRDLPQVPNQFSCAVVHDSETLCAKARHVRSPRMEPIKQHVQKLVEKCMRSRSFFMCENLRNPKPSNLRCSEMNMSSTEKERALSFPQPWEDALFG